MLRMLLCVFLGGGVGSVLRWLVGLALKPASASFPFGTLTVNLVGALLIGLLVGWFARHQAPMWQMLLVTGFCGGFTTFSTFSLDAVQMMKCGNTTGALLYMAITLVAGLCLTGAALWLCTSSQAS